MNPQMLCELARQKRSDMLRAAEAERRARLLDRNTTSLRARLSTALTAAGETFLALGATLAKTE